VGFELNLSLRSEYALLALTHLARQQRYTYHTPASIAEAQRVPLKFLEPILLKLRQARYLRAARGPRNGFRLAKNASEISVAEIIRLIDDEQDANKISNKHYYESTPIEIEPALMQLVREIRAYTTTRLEKTTIADVTTVP
jgi:Rrf2 family protein